MKRLVRGIIAGSIIGAAVGLVMLARKKPSMFTQMKVQPEQIKNQTRGTVKMVKDHTMRWTSALKDGTEAISQRLASRNPKSAH